MDGFHDGLGAAFAHGRQRGRGLFYEPLGCQGCVANAQLLDVARAPDDSVGAHVAVQERGQAEGGFADFRIPRVETAEVGLAVLNPSNGGVISSPESLATFPFNGSALL